MSDPAAYQADFRNQNRDLIEIIESVRVLCTRADLDSTLLAAPSPDNHTVDGVDAYALGAAKGALEAIVAAYDAHVGGDSGAPTQKTYLMKLL